MVQKMGGVVIYIDREKKLDGQWAATIGVDMKDAKLVPYPRKDPDKWHRWERPYIEGILEDTMHVVRQAKEIAPEVPMLIVYESINTIPGKEEWLAGYEDRTLGVKARVYSSLLDDVVDALDESPVAMVAVSQHRSRIPRGVSRVETEKISGGAAVKHASVLVLDMWRAGVVEEVDQPVAQEVGVYVEKNQIGVPFRKSKFRIRFNLGIDSLQSILDRGLELGVCQIPGAKAINLEPEKDEEDVIDDDDGLDNHKKAVKRKGAGWIEFHDRHGVIHKCQGVWGRSGLLALEQRQNGVVQSICEQLAEAQGWSVYNPISKELVVPSSKDARKEERKEQNGQTDRDRGKGRGGKSGRTVEP
jgi:RecA/RadA recombinase